MHIKRQVFLITGLEQSVFFSFVRHLGGFLLRLQELVVVHLFLDTIHATLV
jgi:hypothetical protein